MKFAQLESTLNPDYKHIYGVFMLFEMYMFSNTE